MVQRGWFLWASSLALLALVEGTGSVDMEVCRFGCSAVPQDMWPYCCESHNTCCQEFVDSCVHDCLPRVNSGDVSVVEERPGLCCALYNLCCFRETPRISPRRQNPDEPVSLPIAHRFSFPTPANHQRQQTATTFSAPAVREEVAREERPEPPRKRPSKPTPSRPSLPRKLPSIPQRDSEDSAREEKRPNLPSAPRRPQLPRKLPNRPGDSNRNEGPKKLPERQDEPERPQIPNRPKSAERPQTIPRKTVSRPSDSEEPQSARKLPNRPGGQQSRPRKIKVRNNGPRSQRRKKIDAEPAEEKEVRPVQATIQRDRQTPAKPVVRRKPAEPEVEPTREIVRLPSAAPVEREPKIIAVANDPPAQQTNIAAAGTPLDTIDDIVLLPNPLSQTPEPIVEEIIAPVVLEEEDTLAEVPQVATDAPTYLPVESPQETDIPTFLPIEIPEVAAIPVSPAVETAVEADIPTYLPLEIEPIEAPQPPKEETIVEPIPASPSPPQTPRPSSPEPVETLRVPAPRVAATRGRGTAPAEAPAPEQTSARGSTTAQSSRGSSTVQSSRGRSRGVSSRGRASTVAVDRVGTPQETVQRSRSRSRG